MNLQTQQFGENMGLQWRGMQLSRAQGTEEYQYATGLSAQQFGFGQTMFREQARFTSGRERRLAEMQNKETVTVYGMEKEQREKEFGFQKQQWKLQEEQFKTQIKQFNETKKLQQEELDANRLFWKENKSLTEAAVELQRAQFIENNKLSMESAALQAAQATMQKQVNDLMIPYLKYQGDNEALLNNLASPTLTDMIASLNTVNPLLSVFITHLNEIITSQGGTAPTHTNPTPKDKGNENPPSNPSTPSHEDDCKAHPHKKGCEDYLGSVSLSTYMNRTVLSPTKTASAAGTPAIHIYIGNEEIKSYIVDTVVQDLNK
jgi:hypothetical protein